MIIDTHTHTKPFSTDSGLGFEELLDEQKIQDIGIVLTEHIDLAYGDPSGFYFEPEEYFRTLSPYRSDRLLLGVEIGMTPETCTKDAAIIQAHPFDMVIGSIHFVRGIDIYYPEFFALFQTKEESFDEYLGSMETMVETFDDFDTLGHIDYIGRVAPYEDPELHYGEFSGRIDRILKTLVEKDKALEINTRRFNDPKALAALQQIFLRYKELGGRYVTIGSDAHKKEAIGLYLKEAYAFADTLGLTPVYYKERKRQLL